MHRKIKTILLNVLICSGLSVLLGHSEIVKAEVAAGAKSPAAQTSQIVYEGKMIDGVKWTDSNGENVLIVSEKRTAPKKNGGFTQYIFAYHYATKNGVTRKLWEIRDFAENYCDAGKGLVSPVYLQDIDDDGAAETMFVYQVQGNCDVSPASYKLMMHSRATKLAIRGSNNVNAANVKEPGKKEFDPEFDRFPPVLKTAASRFWDEYVKDFTGK